jgi:CheY-like chemotaxis protein
MRMESDFDHHVVLLVEDNPDDALLMESAWKAARIRNRMPVVSDGEQALAYLNGTGKYADRDKYPFPIAVFLDLKLPRIDGLDVLAAIRQDSQLCHLHVDVLSASARSADVEKALSLGANSYIVKPSRVEALVEMLSAWRSLAQFKMFVVPPIPMPA